MYSAVLGFRHRVNCPDTFRYHKPRVPDNRVSPPGRNWFQHPQLGTMSATSLPFYSEEEEEVEDESQNCQPEPDENSFLPNRARRKITAPPVLVVSAPNHNDCYHSASYDNNRSHIFVFVT